MVIEISTFCHLTRIHICWFHWRYFPSCVSPALLPHAGDRPLASPLEIVGAMVQQIHHQSNVRSVSYSVFSLVCHAFVR
jgi:hypothetical protein